MENPNMKYYINIKWQCGMQCGPLVETVQLTPPDIPGGGSAGSCASAAWQG